MGKLSYVNRPIEGVQAGQVIAKALLKRLPGGPGFKAALRDPCVELDASGKKLGKDISKKNSHDDGDELDGWSELTSALILTLRSTEKVVVLEELCLRGNQLSATSLKDLAEIVELAAGDLRDLDLSENDLVIENEADVQAWERFLSSFARCYVLRRLDLSGNSLGAKGFEVLAKMYGREAPLELSLNSALKRDENLTPSPSEGDLMMLESTKHATLRTRAASNARELAMEGGAHKTPTKSAFYSTKAPRQSSESPRKENISPSKAGHIVVNEDPDSFPTTSGLRSIPYIVLANTNMNDACALYLSYVLASHHPRDQLMARVPRPKAGPPLQQLEHYDLSCKDCEGIIYLPNASLTSAGIKVLKVAEKVRRDVFLDTSHEEAISGPQTPLQTTRRISDAPSTPHHPESNSHHRVSSASKSSDHSSPTQPTTSEIHQARSRIQGDILRDHGPQANELWYCSLKILSIARAVLLKPSGLQESHSAYLRNQLPEQPDALTLSQLNLAVLNLGAGRDAPPSPISPGQATPVIIPNLHQRRARTDSSAMYSLTMTPLALAPPNSVASRQEAKSGMKPLPTAGDYRCQLFGGLSKALWSRIFGLVADPRDVVSESQRQRIASWAWDRGTLEREREFLGKVQAQQIWRVLEDLECLEYESRM